MKNIPETGKITIKAVMAHTFGLKEHKVKTNFLGTDMLETGSLVSVMVKGLSSIPMVASMRVNGEIT